jgi:hypothetical protein
MVPSRLQPPMMDPAVKLFIAGHSDSTAAHLGEGELPWAERTRAWLEDTTGTPWELTGVRFAPIGPRAVDYLMGAVEREQPDLVIIPFTAYVCTVGSVAESVRHRFGERAARYFARAERTVEARARTGSTGKTAHSMAKRLARRVLGARPLASVEATAGIYEQVLRQLARLESVQVVAVADARFSEQVQKLEPKLHRRMDAMYDRLLPAARAHRFVVADLEGTLRRAPDRSVFYQADGIHTTAAFHAVYFEVLKEVLPQALSGAGSKGVVTA